MASILRSNPSPEGRRWREAPDEGISVPLTRRQSNDGRHPLPSGEVWAPQVQRQCSMNMPNPYMVPSSVLKYTRPFDTVIPASDAAPPTRFRLE